MLENELKQNIAHNITALRKQSNMTQADLAEQLNYSDKSISKWERGDGLPDIYVLVKIADLFGVTLNDLIYLDSPKQVEEMAQKDTTYPKRVLITALSGGLVWFIATVPEGKVFSGWVRETINEDGSTTLTVMFEPDPETGKVSIPEGTVLEPMVLYALFEDAADVAAETPAPDATEGA